MFPGTGPSRLCSPTLTPIEQISLRKVTARGCGPLLILAVMLSPSAIAQGQENPVAGKAGSPSSDRSLPSSGIRFHLEVNSRFGTDTYVPETWGELHLHLENSSRTDRELLCTSYFAPDATLQFGRKVWLPAQSRLNLSHPVLLPPADHFPNLTANIHSLLVDQSQGGEVLVKNESGQLRHERSLLVAKNGRHTGIVAGWNTSDFVPQDVLDLVIANRVHQGLDHRTTVLGGQFLPPDEHSLKYLDHLILAENRLVDDEAGLTALRRWLHAGGRLWIMLDRVDPILLERLLGDEFQGTVVDRVGLTSVRIDKAPTLVSPEGEAGETVEYEEPVALTQLVVSGMRVWNTVDGWPVALTTQFGEGRLLVTMLGPRGWIKPVPPSTSKPGDRPPGNSAFVPCSPMEDLAAYVLSPRVPEPLPRKALETFTGEFVSYSVPSWWTIAGILCGLFSSLLVIGLWLRRIDRVEHFGWVGSLLALTFGMVLFGIGMFYRYRVPPTLASVQFAQAIPGTDDVRTRGMIAVYRPDADEATIRSDHGGEIWPDMSGSEGAIRRLVTTDLGEFYWDGLSNSSGLHRHAVATSRAVTSRIEAEATLDAKGIVGKCTGIPANGTDSLLATRFGRMSLTFGSEGDFTAAAENVMRTDQFLGTNFVSDQQDKRRRILQELFRQRQWQNSLITPQVLVWVDGWDPGMTFGKDLSRRGDTLLTVPLKLVRPVSGTEFVIPAPLVNYATTLPPDGSFPTGFWNDLKGEWQERTAPATTWLAFLIPSNLLPLQATRAQLHIQVTGPIGRVEILGVKAGQVTKLDTVDSPVGTVIVSLTDANALSVSDAGELVLGISGGVPAQSATNIPTTVGGSNAIGTPAVSSAASSHWKIESLALQLWAKTVERSEKD